MTAAPGLPTIEEVRIIILNLVLQHFGVRLLLLYCIPTQPNIPISHAIHPSLVIDYKFVFNNFYITNIHPLKALDEPLYETSWARPNAGRFIIIAGQNHAK